MNEIPWVEREAFGVVKRISRLAWWFFGIWWTKAVDSWD